MLNCRVKKVNQRDVRGVYLWGFILMAHNNLIEFYTTKIKERDLWIHHLAQFVVFLDVKDDYAISKLIGNGNFAKVHLCQVKQNLAQKFAMKTVCKSKINSS